MFGLCDSYERGQNGGKNAHTISEETSAVSDNKLNEDLHRGWEEDAEGANAAVDEEQLVKPNKHQSQRWDGAAILGQNCRTLFETTHS